MDWEEFKAQFLEWEEKTGNSNYPVRRSRGWLVDNEEEELKKLNILLDEYGPNDFYRAVEIVREKPWRCRTAAYICGILKKWGMARDDSLSLEYEQLLEKFGDNELVELIRDFGSLLTFQVKIEQIDELVEIFPTWWVKRALEETIGRGIGDIRYVKAILRNWEIDGGPNEGKATHRQIEYIKGLLDRAGKSLDEYCDKQLKDMTRQQARELLPILKELPVKPNEPKPKKESPYKMSSVDKCGCEQYAELIDRCGIYFIQQEPFGPNGGAIKIGISNDFAARLSSLQAANPDTLTLVATISTLEGRKSQETALHEQFSELNLFSEWFKAEEPLISYVENLEGFLGWGHADETET